MGRILIILTLILSAPAPSFAGAWLREKGKTFTALSVTAYKDEDGFYDSKTSIYAEYGLRPGITIGTYAHGRFTRLRRLTARASAAVGGTAGLRLMPLSSIERTRRQFTNWISPRD